MLDTLPTQTRQRVTGRGAIGLGKRIRDLHQSGAAKVFLPRVHDATTEVVFLNTAGGLTGGDRLAYQLDLDAGAHALATTQTAERAYASSAGHADLRVDLNVAENARLDCLPQETILFDQSALMRETRVSLAKTSRFLFVETVVLGRAAMGETLASVRFWDRRLIHRAGVPVFVEPLGIDTDVLNRRGNPAILGGARAFATVGFFAPDAETALAPVRQALNHDGVQAAVSAWDGKLILRALAGDGFPLRRQIARVLEILRQGPLPRVWQEK